jgi:hypothetical protein
MGRRNAGATATSGSHFHDALPGRVMASERAGPVSGTPAGGAFSFRNWRDFR